MCDSNYINIQNEYHMEQHKESDIAEHMIDSLLDAVDEVKKLNVRADNLYEEILSAYEELHETYVNLVYKKSNE